MKQDQQITTIRVARSIHKKMKALASKHETFIETIWNRAAEEFIARQSKEASPK